ncbi:DUF2550 family protein [Microlunatus sp. Gsoil 973]|nr:DUF2550 family protein [Microlunatus sp. Gsoil 973]
MSAAEVIGVVLVLLAAVLVGLAVRRRWLARNGGTFECSMRHRPHDDGTTTPSTGWVLGVARYGGDDLEWFRFFSLAWWPKYTFRRSEVSILEHRAPTAAEAVALYADQEVVSVTTGSGDNFEYRDLAMSPDSLTGMLSWLEAAPPGINRR